MPLEFAFGVANEPPTTPVVMLPTLSTSTLPAALPVPPFPPMLRAAPTPPFCRVSAPLKPPSPPEPPIDWARMPSDERPEVEMSPVLPTWASPAILLAPPAPPIETPTFADCSEVVTVAATANPPLPPPPATDSAKMPLD